MGLSRSALRGVFPLTRSAGCPAANTPIPNEWSPHGSYPDRPWTNEDDLAKARRSKRTRDRHSGRGLDCDDSLGSLYLDCLRWPSERHCPRLCESGYAPIYSDIFRSSDCQNATRVNGRQINTPVKSALQTRWGLQLSKNFVGEFICDRAWSSLTGPMHFSDRIRMGNCQGE